MMELDKWVDDNFSRNSTIQWTPPLNLIPNPGEDRVCHPRIISWASFFNTDFTKICADYAKETCLPGQLPVPSQDGFTWYVATRLGYGITRTKMKNRGFQHWSNDRNVREKSEEAMKG